MSVKPGELALPESATDLEGWTVDDVRAQLRSSAASGAIEKTRTGAWLWAAAVLMTDSEYEAEVAQVAAQWEVQRGTVRAWRLKAEIRLGLDPPNPRAVAARERGFRGATRVARGSKSVDNSVPPERVTPTVVERPPEPNGERPTRAKDRAVQLTLPFADHVRAVTAGVDELAKLPDADWKALRLAVVEAGRLRQVLARQPRPLIDVLADGECAHPKTMLTVLPYLTRCDTAKGGCGKRLR